MDPQDRVAPAERGVRPGFGSRHPRLTAILAEHTPALSNEITWDGGAMPLRVSAYDSIAELPEEIVTSVRCIVRVGDQVVFCENDDTCHPWPGGRREPGESYVDTAVREVREETGWVVDPDSARQLGWLRMEHLAPRRADYPYPYPDFLQLVFCATATERAGGPDASWTDTQGYERVSRLVTVDEALERTSPQELVEPFLRVLSR
jgi:ADP-ribose pyrophosphatase YjhB (NUDIX family)